MHKFKIEAIKFTLVGAVNFVITFIVFTGMLKVFRINYLISLITSWFVGMLFSYRYNFVFVFRAEEKIQFRSRFIRYSMASILSVLLNIIFLRTIVGYTDYDPFYVQMILVPFIVVFNFSTAKFWSFK